MSKQFNKKEYDAIYMSEHKSKFSTSLNKDELEEMNKIFKQHEITKADFIRYYFKKIKEELKMIKYMIVYEDEEMKNENESTYRYSDCEMDSKFYDTLEEARKELDNFESYIWVDGNVVKTMYKRIATLYRVKVNDDDEIDDNFDWEQIDTK